MKALKIRKTRVPKGKMGMVFRKKEFVRVLNAGSALVGLGEEVQTFCLFESLPIRLDFDVLLEDPSFRDAVKVIEVADGTMVLKFSNGILSEVLTVGRRVYWKQQVKHTFRTVNLTEDIPDDLPLSVLSNPLLAVYVHQFIVEKHQFGILIKDNTEVNLLEAGEYRHWKSCSNYSLKLVDRRSQIIEVSGQELLTKDKAAVRMNFDVKYIVTDVNKAVFENSEYERQLYVQVQLALRASISNRTLDEILESKDEISAEVLKSSVSFAEELGLIVQACGLRDIILPGDMKDIMNEVLIAQKRAQANVITRREETASTRSLLNTAKLMEDNKMLFKLKEMEYVEKITDKIVEIKVGGNGNILDELKALFSTVN